MSEASNGSGQDGQCFDLPDTASFRFFRAILPPFRRLGDAYNSLLDSYREVKKRAGLLSQQQEDLQSQIRDKSAAITGLESRYDATLREKQGLEQDMEDLLAQQNALQAQRERLQSEKKELLAENDALLADKKDLQQRYDLVSRAISARGDATPKFQALSDILENEFLPFTNNINVLKGEADAIIRMRGVVDQLRVIESMARFMDKTVVALSGGFSSGKSSFINSMLNDNTIKLPVGMERMTAIPAYVGHGDTTRILGYSVNGGVVEIPTHLYSRLSHAYVKAFDFNLRDLLPYVAIETPLRDLENISFIDLPGYDPGASEAYTDSDNLAASEFLEQAHALIWVIGLDSNGTIPRSDIEFLIDHADRVERLYVVVNKADLRPASDRSGVMEEVRDNLELYGIDYEGICVYSSERSEEFDHLGSSLMETLSKWNSQHNSLAEIIAEIDAVFTLYYQAFDEEIERRKTMYSHTHNLELDLLEIGAFNEESANRGWSDIFKMYSGQSSESTLSSSLRDRGESLDEDSRNMKIDSIKNYISELKVAYSVESVEEQRDYAASIHKRMLEIL